MRNQSGQALVLVLLSLAVVLTLVLYILSRTVTDIAVTSREEEAVRAFSAAEAGVEKALIVGSSTGTTTIGDATFNADVSDFAEETYDFNYPINLPSGDTLTTWFVSHNTNGSLGCDVTHPCFSGSYMKVCWGKLGTSSSSSTTPAVEGSIVYATTPGDYSTLQIARVALDPYVARGNNFSVPDTTNGTCDVGGELYQFGKTITFSDLGIPIGSYSVDNGLQYAKIRMLYNSTESQTVGISVDFPGNNTLPSQGLSINSTGTSGEANRRLEIFQSWPEPPPIFDSVIFSSTGITK